MILDTLKSLEIDKSGPMKFVEPSHFADPDAAARKLVEIANGRGGSGRAHLYRADQRRVSRSRRLGGSIPRRARRHESGTYVKFTPAGAEMFA